MDKLHREGGWTKPIIKELVADLKKKQNDVDTVSHLKDVTVSNLLDSILQESSLDNRATKQMKAIISGIKYALHEDCLLLPEILQTKNMIQMALKEVSSGDESQKTDRDLSPDPLSKLENQWRSMHLTNQEKLTVLRAISQSQPYILQSIQEEESEAQYRGKKYHRLLALYGQRGDLRCRLEELSIKHQDATGISGFNRESSKVYTALRKANKRILEESQIVCKQLKCSVQELPAYKGVHIKSLIEIDYWEEDYLRKLEARNNWQKSK